MGQAFKGRTKDFGLWVHWGCREALGEGTSRFRTLGASRTGRGEQSSTRLQGPWTFRRGRPSPDAPFLQGTHALQCGQAFLSQRPARGRKSAAAKVGYFLVSTRQLQQPARRAAQQQTA